jgi:Mrp family chromosome partitioning ATPase
VTTKRSGRYSEQPPLVAAGARGAPLPLVTQPMVALDDSLQTRVDQALPAIDPALTVPGTAAKKAEPGVLFGKANVVATSVPHVSHSPRPMPAGPPPEIGLTQHTLPGDEVPDARLVLMREADSERAAAFRVLRHHLLEAGRPQVVIVSSPSAGEGKTTVALNLALALAECGRAKVLLAETHVRRPQLANVFKCIPPWCFAEQLAAHRHQPMLPWSLIDIPQVWLHVAAINPRIEKTQLLDAPAFAIAMERLRIAGYDHIVIDAPPVLGSADVNLMADAADAVLFAVRARTSNSRDLRKAVDQIGQKKVVGTVLVE